MFKVGDLVKVNGNSLWYDDTKNTIGLVVEVDCVSIGVDFGKITSHSHSLNGVIDEKTGLWLYESDLELCKRKGGNRNAY